MSQYYAPAVRCQTPLRVGGRAGRGTEYLRRVLPDCCLSKSGDTLVWQSASPVPSQYRTHARTHRCARTRTPGHPDTGPGIDTDTDTDCFPRILSVSDM
eukprot:2184490-Rhodomonas_salina.1